MSNYLFAKLCLCFVLNICVFSAPIADVDPSAGVAMADEKNPDSVDLTGGPTFDDLLQELAEIEEELEDDPTQDSSNLVRDLVLECQRLNISTDVLDPTSPNFDPAVDWDILDAMTEGIRIIACAKHNWTEVKCPSFNEEEQCLYQPIKLMDGYGGLGCYTQCTVIPCSEVGEDELKADENQKAQNNAEDLENAQAVNRALLKVINEPDLVTEIEQAEVNGENANGNDVTVIEDEITIPVEVSKDGGEGEGIVEAENGEGDEKIPLDAGNEKRR